MPETPTDQTATPTLEYGSYSRARVWRRRILRGFIAALFLSIGVCIYIWRAEIWLRTQRIYWFRACMVHVTPAQTKLLEADPVKAKALVSGNEQYLDAASIVAGPTQPLAMYVPKALREYEAISLPPALPTGAWDGEVIFLGARKTPSGKSRLVLIRGSRHQGRIVMYDLSGQVLTPPPVWGGVPRTVSQPFTIPYFGRYLPIAATPGVADRNDPSHISIDFMIDLTIHSAPNRRGTIDVQLRDDDTLNFKLRDPATTQGLPK